MWGPPAPPGPPVTPGPAVIGSRTAAEIRSLRLASRRGRRASAESRVRLSSARSTLSGLEVGLPLLGKGLWTLDGIFRAAKRPGQEGLEAESVGERHRETAED